MFPGMLDWFEKNWDMLDPSLPEPHLSHTGKVDMTFTRYDGPHPILLDNHPWGTVEDIRAL